MPPFPVQLYLQLSYPPGGTGVRWSHILPEDLRFIQFLMKYIPEQHPARKDSGKSGDLTTPTRASHV